MARIRKKRFSAIVVLCIVGMFLLFGMLAFSQGRKQAQDVKRLKENGTLVTAQITKYHYDSDDHDYTLYYEYTDEAGTVYTGSTGRSYGSYDEANAHYGEPIEIYIDANGESVRADFPDQSAYMNTAYYVLWAAFGGICLAIVLLAVSLIVSRRRARSQGAPTSSIKPSMILVPLCIFGCFAGIFAGIATHRTWLIFASTGALFGGAFVVSVVMLIGMFVRAKRHTVSPQTGETLSEAESEAQMRARVNSTSYTENKEALAQWQFSHLKETFRHSSHKEKTLGCLFLCWLLGLFVAIPIFAAFRIVPGVIACFCGFCGTILLAGIISAVHQKCMRSEKRFDPTRTYCGEVRSCTVSSSTSTGSRSTRIMSVTYRIVLSVDGAEKIAYSREFYETGEKVRVWLHKKNAKAAYIVDRENDSAPSDRQYAQETFAREQTLQRLEAEKNQRRSLPATDKERPIAQEQPTEDGSLPAEQPTEETQESKKPRTVAKKPRKIG
ncbi:MAG: hypothetical protein K2L51_01745 [Clostridiales bacterium]|nr:hypothetical protein [Clostridiales bacterium]